MAAVLNCSEADFAYVENWEFLFFVHDFGCFFSWHLFPIIVLLLYIHFSHFSSFNFLIMSIFASLFSFFLACYYAFVPILPDASILDYCVCLFDISS